MADIKSINGNPIVPESVADGAVGVDGLAEDVVELLDNKADIDGYYSQLTAGLAENLIGRGDAVPAEYLYRTAGGTADIEDGIATVNCINGNTLVWNQMVNSSMIMYVNSAHATKEMVGDVVKATSTVASAPAASFYIPEMVYSEINNHTLLCVADVKVTSSASSTTFRLGYASQGTAHNKEVRSGSWQRFVSTLEVNMQSGASNNAFVYYDTNANLSVGDTVEIKNFQLFDLTLMFGSGNEPATVEEFEAMFPLPYYPYSTPKLLPVDMRGIETVGFNLWDEEWEVGSISATTGQNEASTKVIRSKNYIPVFPNTKYYRTPYPGYTLAYDADKNFISTINTNGGVPTPSNCRYIRFRLAADYGPTYNNDICVNLVWSGYRNGEYEEHWSAERAIDTSRFFSTGMKKVGDKADALYADHYDTVIGSVDLGTLTWTYNSSWHSWYTDTFSAVKDPGSNATVANLTHPSYVAIAANYLTNTTDEQLGIGIATTSKRIIVRNGSDSVQPTGILYYELATPTTTEIDPPLNLSYKVSDFGTERIMVDETADAPQTAPVSMEVEYGLNAIDTIRRLPTNYVPRKELEPKLDEKADVDGYYAAMTVGAADNLTGRGDGASGQYLYRTAGGDEDIADGVANIRSIKGQTLVWNQLCKTPYSSAATTDWNGATVSVDSNNYVTMSGTITKSGTWMFMSNDNVGIVAGHKYLISGLDEIVGLSFRVYSASGNVTHATVATATKRIITPSVTSPNLSLYMMAATTGAEVSFKGRPQFFDLTLMFGAGNEPSTVEEFEALFPNAYYPYSEPTLLSVNMGGIETVGFNLWDEEWEVGSIGSAGNVTDATKIRSKNYIPVFPGQTYYIKSPSTLTFYGYDAQKNVIAYEFNGYTTIGRTNATLTIPSGVHYLRFYMTGTIYNNDICINLSWSGYRDGEYEDYWNSQREIPVKTYFPDGMMGFGEYADALYSDRAEHVIGKATIALGDGVTFSRTEEPNEAGLYSHVLQHTDAAWASSGLSDVPMTGGYVKVSNAYNTLGVSSAKAFASSTTQGVQAVSQTKRAYLRWPSLLTEQECAQLLSGVNSVLLYKLGTPTITEINPPLNLSYKVSDFGTEKVMVDEEADAPQSAPPVIQTAYGINATDTVRRLPTQYISHESFQQFVAALQSAVGITVTETWDENDGRYEYAVTQTGE